MNIQQAIADIVTTKDLLERTLKLSGLVTTLQEKRISAQHLHRSCCRKHDRGGYAWRFNNLVHAEQSGSKAHRLRTVLPHKTKPSGKGLVDS